MPPNIGKSIDKISIPDDLQRAVVLIQADRLTEAHRILLELIKADPQNPKLWLLLAWTAASRTAAIEFYETCYRLDPNNELAKEGLNLSIPPKEIISHIDFINILGQMNKNQEPGPGSDLAGQVTISPPHQNLGLDQLLHRSINIPFPWIMMVYLVLIALAELVTTFGNPQLGIAIHGALLVILFFHASGSRVKVQRIFLFTVALAPLIRLLSLSMPLMGFKYTYWYAIIGVPLLLSAYLVFRLTGYKVADVGITSSKLSLQFLIGLTGLGLGWFEYQILKPEPMVSSLRLEEIWIPVLILLLFTGFLEEFIFRGLMQRASLDALGKYGLYYVSLLFAVMHIGYRSVIDFLFVLVVGFVFGLIAKHTRSIWGVTLAHGLTNVVLYIILPFL
jgi:uncharacterized protein